jgi:glucokinase
MYLGIDVGGTNLKCGIIDDGDNLVYQHTIPTNAQKGRDGVLRSISNIIGRALKHYPDVETIGIGIGGVVDRNGIVKIAPNLPGWYNVDVAKYLRKIYDIPVYLDNDANIAALAEMLIGSCKDENDFFYVSLGTGVSAAFVYDRKIIKGVTGGAGDLGHLIMDCNVPIKDQEKPYRTAILEEYIGKNKIAEQAKEVIRKYPNSIMHTYEKLDPYFISMAVTKGDKAGTKIFKVAGRMLGIGLASALNLLDIPLVILGGGLAQSHSIMFKTAYQTIKERALPTVADRLEIRHSHFVKDTGIIGAALYGKYEFEKSILGHSVIK